LLLVVVSWLLNSYTNNYCIFSHLAIQLSNYCILNIPDLQIPNF
jgi:hypothetical protein